MFIHDALSELLVCGETEVPVADLRIKINQLSRKTEAITGYQKQFQVFGLWVWADCEDVVLCMCVHQTLELVSSQCRASYLEAKADYNVHKNRYPDKLPSE